MHYHKTIFFLCLCCFLLFLTACESVSTSHATSNNLINKVNAVEEHWINYQGISENDKSMIQSQFIPYNPDNKYEVSLDTYISYFNGEDFIKTELYEDTPNIIDTVEEADGIILSFNRENKSGMQLVEVE